MAVWRGERDLSKLRFCKVYPMFQGRYIAHGTTISNCFIKYVCDMTYYDNYVLRIVREIGHYND